METAAEFRSELNLMGDANVEGEVDAADEVVDANVDTEVPDVVEALELLANAAAMRLLAYGAGGGGGPRLKGTPTGHPTTPFENVGVRRAVEGANTAGQTAIGGEEAGGRATSSGEDTGDGLVIGCTAVSAEGGAATGGVDAGTGAGRGLWRERERVLLIRRASASSSESQ